MVAKLKDLRAKAKILMRIQKLEQDEHFGECEPVGEGIRELKINYAKGYRIYFKRKRRKNYCVINWWRQSNSTE